MRTEIDADVRGRGGAEVRRINERRAISDSFELTDADPDPITREQKRSVAANEISPSTRLWDFTAAAAENLDVGREEYIYIYSQSQQIGGGGALVFIYMKSMG